MFTFPRIRAAVRAFVSPPDSQSQTNVRSIQYPPDIQLVTMGSLLKGKNVLITGAGRNIGRAIALECIQQGANVYFIEIDPELKQKLEKDLKAVGGCCQGFICDITNFAQIDQVFQGLTKMDIAIDVLINNVGIHLPSSIRKFDLAEWQTTYQTNVLGPVYLTHLFAQEMIHKQIMGNIIFLSSIHQWIPVGCAGYSSSKAAIGMTIQELAIELAPMNIRVNGIAPGWTFIDDNGIPIPDQRGQLYETSIPPQYIGRAAVYLASNYFSQYTTGTVLKVDSGLSIMHRTVPIHNH